MGACFVCQASGNIHGIRHYLFDNGRAEEGRRVFVGECAGPQPLTIGLTETLPNRTLKSGVE
jgi:hypothetical protein